uniref:Nodule Cysteine-Rich (NCR) secreted peptide n=1 Tax=Meloidogyne hapla TaxID=6305 RepID=A0A1I8B2K7_MELHA
MQASLACILMVLTIIFIFTLETRQYYVKLDSRKLPSRYPCATLYDRCTDHNYYTPHYECHCSAKSDKYHLYPLHISLLRSECFPNAKGVIKRHDFQWPEFNSEPEYIYYCVSSIEYGDCKEYYRTCNM